MRDAAAFIANQSLGSAGSLSGVLRGLRQALKHWHDRRQLQKLSELDDHLLADLGFSRDELRWALDLPFSRDPMRELRGRRDELSGIGWRQ